MRILTSVLALTLVQPAFAEETRHLGAHEHGVGRLDMAIEGAELALEFTAPGADIVGFEYTAQRAEDLAAVDKALAVLSQPLALFQLPEAAECEVQQAHVSLQIEEHEHADHHDDEEDHDDHAEHHDEHAEEHEHHDADHAHEGEHHDHDASHAHSEGHSEFHAQYQITCAAPQALDSMTFAYFDHFSDAREVEVQLISDAGAQAFEVERDSPVLDLKGAL